MSDLDKPYANGIEGRFGNWMQTFSGKAFWPLDARPEEVDIYDIGHALSRLCRYNGHCEEFYSVAEHSVYVSRLVPEKHALCALLHDATEAYLADIIRPVKTYLSEYARIEQGLWEVIADKWKLPKVMPEVVKAMDNAVLLAEGEQIMKKHPMPWGIQGTAAPISIHCLTPNAARKLFMNRYWEVFL